jgi:hypothetical protein
VQAGLEGGTSQEEKEAKEARRSARRSQLWKEARGRSCGIAVQSENLGPQPKCHLSKAARSAVLCASTVVWAGRVLTVLASVLKHRVAGSARPASCACLLHAPTSFRLRLAQRHCFPSFSCTYYNKNAISGLYLLFSPILLSWICIRFSGSRFLIFHLAPG